MAATSLKGSYDGYAPFIYPSIPKPLLTYYRVYGSLTSPITPLVIIHGGPGFPHNYLLNHSHLTHTLSIPVILYDQIGSGLSTHLPETASTPSLWDESIFFSQIHQLLTHLGISQNYDILGSSWGGMLGSAFAATKPPGLRRLVLSNSAASKALSIENRLKSRKLLPREMEDVLDEADRTGSWRTGEVGAVMKEFNTRFACTVVPEPEDMQVSERLYGEDTTVASAMGDDNDGNPFDCTGFFNAWTMVGRAKDIVVPSLVINGIHEFASGDAVKPFLDEIEDVRLVTLEGTTHCPHFERKGEYMRVVGEFLTG
ncbi:related to proline iminopeptidase [Rhynchosporium secalis]|uniref:Related to proline iminopeptidase n=2 Tax=Rhynchosporium TaxID=38037 RepID=A0A1E1MNI4_RHYSE|nr:related to proline iminopeptidase [Rhynchosporium secalis]